MLVSGVTEAEIDGVAERLANGFEEPFEVGGIRVPISASIGRSTYPADAPDADGLLRRVTRGPVVVLSCAPELVERFWMVEIGPATPLASPRPQGRAGLPPPP